MSYTIIIIAVTALISVIAFNNEELYNKLILWPRKMDNPAEYYRLLTSGFIHADWNHLFFNMFSLYIFGEYVETTLQDLQLTNRLFLMLYLTAIVIACLPSYLKNRGNSHYRSLGASGGVSAIIFFIIYFHPWSKIGIIFLPSIPAIIFGVLYLIYEAYMDRRGKGNINHSAHFWGSAYGVLFALAVDPTHGRLFMEEIMTPRF